MTKETARQGAFHTGKLSGGPVECLGQTFASDDARRAYFLDRLREHLADPAFREIEGFPIGSDEDILRLSDPPYYTSCPNPFLTSFVEHYGTTYDETIDDYHREPFAADSGAGKTHPLYTAHSYHSKIPHLAIMPCVLHYTQPGDLVLDGFSGSGMTGLAAQLCGQPEQEFKAQITQEWRANGSQLPTWGARRPLLVDLSPAANFIAYNLNADIDADEFEESAQRFFAKIEESLSWMYETLHTDGKTKGRINYVVWSEMVLCPNCGGDVVFIEQAFNQDDGTFAESYPCPHCATVLTNRTIEHRFTTELDSSTGQLRRRLTYTPTSINYTVGKHKFTKKLDYADQQILEQVSAVLPSAWFPTNALPIDQINKKFSLAPKGVTHMHHFYLSRSLHALATMWDIARSWPDARVRNYLLFMVEQCFWTMSVINRYRPTGYSQVNQFLTGVYYIPPSTAELSPWYVLTGKFQRLIGNLRKQLQPQKGTFAISTESSSYIPIPNNSIDYIYTDPPFGDFVPYGDLNILIESWHRILTPLKDEVLVDSAKGKDLADYQGMIQLAFSEYYRVLKPGRWMTLVFHNSKNAVWTAIQAAMGNVGFVVADVRALDRQQGAFRQVTAAAAVKMDLVISAYKPTSTFTERFEHTAGTKQGVWDFVSQHLAQLPVFTGINGKVDPIAERQSHLLYDRMLAFHLKSNATIPLDAGEFYIGLKQRFPERDGMFFLPQQVAEYDQKRLAVAEVEQLALFVSDEQSTIQWLHQELRSKPQTYQDLHPKFLRELRQARYEQLPELSLILDQTFLRDGSGRWYVPDPAQQADRERLREKALLREFELYKTGHGKLKQVRSEAVRAGFKAAWRDRDYTMIVQVARRLPEAVLQEDSQLLMYFDNAVDRADDNMQKTLL